MKKFFLTLVFGGLVCLPNMLSNQVFSYTSNLPIGTDRTLANIGYTIVVTKLELLPIGAKMDLTVGVTVPYNGEVNRLYFSATDVLWSEQGGFAEETVRLALAEDYRIPLGKNMEMVLKKVVNDRGTFAEIDCRGLQLLSLDASLIFDNSLIIPADCQNLPCQKLSADFSIVIESWSDLIVDINLPAFQIPTLEGWIFQAERVVFDFSENRKSTIAQLPKDYLQTYFSGDENLWKGVFIESLKVTLPESFEGKERFSFQAQSLVIDERGITGLLSATNVIPEGLAHVGGWGLSVDTLGLEFFTNRLKSGCFGGSLQLPITDSNLNYFGHIFENNRYVMQVDLNENLQFDCWKTASVKLSSESFIKMELVEKRFLAQAVLHGEMGFETFSESGNASNLVKIPSIAFENLTVQNRKPYLTVNKLSYDGTIGIVGFPAQFDQISLQTHDESLQLKCVVNVGLTSATDGGFRGKTGFSIRSRLEETDTRQRWVYDGLSFDEISVNIDEHAFSLKGGLAIFENDQTYGQGFGGHVELKIKHPNILIKSSALFGKTDEFRYWFADALVNFGNSGIPIFAGLNLNGFGGGAYQRMKPVFGQRASSSVGRSSSGILYVPDATTKFGIQAGVTVSAQQNPKVFNGQTSLEMSFNTSGGLNFIQLRGSANIAQELSSEYFEKTKKIVGKLGEMTEEIQEEMRKEAAKDAAITARLELTYDFNNNIFRGLFDTEISMPMLRGSGKAELYLSDEKWFFHVGHPERRFRVDFGVGSISLGAGVYLMAGYDIPAMPKPPTAIANLINRKDFSTLEQSRSRDISSINSGRGFAFGTDFSMNTGELKFLIFFAQLQAQLGFDFMLKDYGDFSCINRTTPIGINGWYGSGQAYAYLAGRLGLEVPVFGKRRRFTILDVKTGALLQAQLPNPVWLSGNLAANYNLLNGLIKGKCNFKFELGEKCELPKISALEGLDVISELSPNANEIDVNVFSMPQVAFNLPIKEFHASPNEVYKIELESFTLKHGNAVLLGDLEWNDDLTSLILSPHEVLPEQAYLEMSVTIRFLERENGVWKPVLNDKNQPQKETKSQTFKTGDRPTTLPISEVLYSYPVIAQQNFYMEESSEAYIQVRRNFDFLFDTETYDYFAHFETPNGTVSLAEMNYNLSNNRIEWAMPSLNAETEYVLKIIGEPRQTSDNFSNVSEGYTSRTLGDSENSTEIRETKISETQVQSQAVEIFSYSFKTSAFPTFASAINSITLENAQLQSLLASRGEQFVSIPDANYLFANVNRRLFFDDADLFGTTYTLGVPLIQVEAVLDAQNTYFSNHVNPLIYQSYDFRGLVKLPRNTGQSIVPTWAVTPLKLSANSRMFTWAYDLPLAYKNDLREVQIQLADQHARGQNIAEFRSILTQNLPVPTFGTYRISLQYRLPCGKLGTASSVIFNYTK